jgi:hypothetical protein
MANFPSSVFSISLWIKKIIKSGDGNPQVAFTIRYPIQKRNQSSRCWITLGKKFKEIKALTKN